MIIYLVLVTRKHTLYLVALVKQVASDFRYNWDNSQS
jgi:hypothetical protein